MPTKTKKRKSKVTKVKKSKLVGTEEQDYMLSTLQKVVLSNKHTRKILTNSSIKFFSKYYFGITLAKHQVRWAHKMVKTKKGLVLAPCGHGKTEVFSKLLIMWIIVRNRNIRILLTSKADGLAVKNLKSIRYELESNTKLIEDFGRFYNPSATWTDHQLYCIRTKNMKDPTLEAVGLMGAITGGRFDVIVLDDVLDALNCRSEEQREKIQDYIDGTLITRLEPWGVIWGVGTRKHYDDYYSKCIKNKAWTVIVNPAIEREPISYEVIESDEPIELEDSLGEKHELYMRVVITSDDQGECLWPDKWSMENLLLLRHTIGTIVFNREYQNTISSDEMALFKIGWLESCRDENLTYLIGEYEKSATKYNAIIQGTDPSLVDDKKKAEKKDTDYSVIITLGIDDKGIENLIGLERIRGLSPSKLEALIEREYYRFGIPDYHFLEANSFGTIHTNNLIEKRGLKKIVKHITDRKKNDLYVGVPGMAVKFENRRIRLPYKTEDDKKKTDKLIVEFHGLGIEKHDDIVMAMWIAGTGVDRYKKGRLKMHRNINRVKEQSRV